MKTLTRIFSFFLLIGLVITLSSSFSFDALIGEQGAKDGNGTCELFTGDGAVDKIVGPSVNLGTGLLKCDGTVSNPSGAYVILGRNNTGTECVSEAFGNVTTSNWRQIIRPDGRTILICNF